MCCVCGTHGEVRGDRVRERGERGAAEGEDVGRLPS